MPTVVTETIGTAARDFSTKVAWEAATDNDHVAADEIREGEIHDDSDFTTPLTTGGSTVDSTRFRRLFAASGEEHDPVAGTGVLSTYASGAYINNEEFLEFAHFGIVTTGTAANLGFQLNGASALFEAIFVDISSGDGTFSSCWKNGSASETCFLRNCIGHGGDWTYELRNDGVDVFNCVADNQKAGLYSVGRGFHMQNNGVVTNCIAIRGASNDFFGNGTESFNASDDTTASGTGSITSQDPALLFEDHTANDYRPASASSNQVDAGTDLSGTFTESFEPGVDHDSGASGWEMGCYDDSAIPVSGPPDIASLKNFTNTLLRM